jgi:SNF2 family DNA or RNA helicase
MLAKALERWRPVVIHGGVPLASSIKEDLTREHLIAEFKSNPECKLFIGNPAACAESISLHMVCHHAVYLDRSFNCAHYLQSLDRIHRLGLAADVRTNYYVMVASDTVDEVVHHRLTQKMSNMRRVVESGLPGEIPGYWGEDLGDEEITDFDMVEDHIRRLFELGAGEAR